MLAESLEPRESSHDWCESMAARDLRANKLSLPVFSTIHELFGAGPNRPVALFAHRGGFHCEEMDSAPENSVSNVEKAIRMGFDGYETDLRLTSDGEYVILHDETLDRTTTGSGNVNAMTFENARKLRLKYPSGNISQEQIPTFRELLMAGRGRIIFLVDLLVLSPEQIQDLVRIVKETESADHVLFWVLWNRKRVEYFERHLKAGMEEIRTSVIWRVSNIEEYQDIVTKFNPKMVDLVPQRGAVELENTFLRVLPKKHFALVDMVVKHRTKIMVSRVETNSYIDVLLDKGVRVFMSREPEVQLTHLVAKGLHR